MLGKSYEEKTSKKPFFKKSIFAHWSVVENTARVVRLPIRSGKYGPVEYIIKFRLPCSIMNYKWSSLKVLVVGGSLNFDDAKAQSKDL